MDPKIEQLLQMIMSGGHPPPSIDPHNAPVQGMQPMQMEDDEDGYWDAQHMGNGRGDSFMMKDGQRMEADPVGNGADFQQILQLLQQLGGGR